MVQRFRIQMIRHDANCKKKPLEQLISEKVWKYLDTTPT